jgi:predicted ATPase
MSDIQGRIATEEEIKADAEAEYQKKARGDIPLLKIGFIGTGGTGKTSVAEKLKGLIPEEFRESIVRETMRRVGATDAGQAVMTAEQKWTLQQYLLDAKFEQDDMYDTGLFDRTPIDHMAYTLYRCADSISDEVFNELAERVQEFAERYDVIFYFPLFDWEVADDGFRQQGRAYRVTHDLITVALLSKMEIEFIDVPDMSVDERVEFILAQLEDVREEVSEQLDDDEPSDDDSSEMRH